MKKYFNQFDFIKKSKKAKSLSYFSIKKNTIFNKEIYKEFKRILKVTNEKRFRLSLHTSTDDLLHNMIIALKKGEIVYPHKHMKSESYHIIKGKMLLVYLGETGEVLKHTVLSNKKSKIARVDKDTYHFSLALNDCIYHESRLGPFDSKNDSIFALWNTNMDRYVENILSKYEKGRL